MAETPQQIPAAPNLYFCEVTKQYCPAATMILSFRPDITAVGPACRASSEELLPWGVVVTAKDCGWKGLLEVMAQGDRDDYDE